MSSNENRNNHQKNPPTPNLGRLDGAELLSKPPSEEFLNNTVVGRQIGIIYGRAAAEGRVASSNPDNPPCDGCKKPYAGTMQCGRCEAAFYCCRECQVSHWSSNHKAECADLKKQSEDKAEIVLENFKNRHLWRLLDMAGTYKAAVHQGLHDKIRDTLASDRDTLLERYRVGEQLLCYTHWVMFVLFRGNRAEGNDHTYSCMDGHRIKGYVKSHPDALFVWMNASVQLLKAYLDRDVIRNSTTLSTLTTVANEVWRGWLDVFTNPVAAKAILLPPATIPPATEGASDGSSATSSGAATATAAGGGKMSKREAAERKRQASIQHATKVVTVIKDAFNLPWAREPEKNLQITLRSVAAIVHVRLLDYQVPVNAEDMFKMKGMQRHMFRNLFVPVAKATVEKGGDLNESEMGAVVERITQSVRLQGEGPLV